MVSNNLTAKEGLHLSNSSIINIKRLFPIKILLINLLNAAFFSSIVWIESAISWNDFKLFKGLSQGFEATRYHSLMVSDIKMPIELKATTDDNIPMAIKIRDKKIYGVQFHPEAILTENGIKIFENFIKL